MNTKSLHAAAVHGDLNSVKKCIEIDGCSVDLLDDFNQTALFHAAWWGHALIVNYLLSKGAQINICNKLGLTALYWAVNHGHLAIAKQLLACGADVSIAGINGWTVLHEAALLGNKDMYMLLANHGACETSTNEWNQTPKQLLDLLRN